jgi:hypothetical protein
MLDGLDVLPSAQAFGVACLPQKEWHCMLVVQAN